MSLQTKVAGWESLQLPDEAQVYHQGAYVGTAKLNGRAYNDSLEVALGHDDQLVVGRAKWEAFCSKAGVGKRRVRLTYELNVRNRHAEAGRGRLLDQIPISEERRLAQKCSKPAVRSSTSAPASSLECCWPEGPASARASAPRSSTWRTSKCSSSTSSSKFPA